MNENRIAILITVKTITMRIDPIKRVTTVKLIITLMANLGNNGYIFIWIIIIIIIIIIIMMMMMIMMMIIIMII
jgi:hypothetical protein